MDARSRLPTWVLLGLFIVVSCVYLVSPVRQNYDSYLAYPTAYAIAHERTLRVDSMVDVPTVRDHYGIVEVDGSSFNRYPWTTSVFLLPAVVATDLAHALGFGGGSRDAIASNAMDTAQAISAGLIAAAVIALVAEIAFERMRASLRRRSIYAVLVALALAFGTGVWSTASRAMWQHGPSLLAIALTVWSLQRLALADEPGRARGRPGAWLPVLAGSATAAAYTFRPTNAIFVLAVTTYVLVRRQALVPFAAGAVVIALPWFAVNRASFGTWFPPYFIGADLQIGSTYPEALAANLVSPSRGLLAFSPVVAVAAFGLTRRARESLRSGLLGLDIMLAAFCGLQLMIVSANATNWWAGASYGPRFLTDALVPLAVLSVGSVAALVTWMRTTPSRGRRRIALIALSSVLLWSVFATSQGALSRSTMCWNDRPDIDQHAERVWDLGDPQFLAGVHHLLSTRSLRDTVLDSCTPS